MNAGLRRYLLLFLMLVTATAPAQDVCTGNLGENLFPDGDFGRGAANILRNDPGIAPGYSYRSVAPPPPDGSYTITNNMGVWSQRYNSWLPLRDNSSDPLGYFMVVNASFQPGRFYRREIDNLCDGTLFEFSADVINVVRQTTPNHTLPNVNFVINGDVIGSTGDIPQNESWRTYRFLFSVPQGQSTALLELVNNAPGGNGNDLGLDNISFRVCGPGASVRPDPSAVVEINGTVSICEGGPPARLTATVIGDQYDTPAIRWQESPDGLTGWTDVPGATDPTYVHTDTRSADYFYRFLLADGTTNLANVNCRVISDVQRITVLPLDFTRFDTICTGNALRVGSSTYSGTGTYVDSLISVRGCDSIVTTNLTVVSDPGLRTGVGPTDPSCSYLADGSIELTNPTNGAPPYRLTFGGDRVPSGFVAINLPAGTYGYAVTDRFGCRQRDSITLTGPPEFVVSLSGDTDVKLGESVNLAIQSTYPIEQYRWQPGTVSDCTTDCVGVELLPQRSDSIILTATSAAGCVYRAGVYVRVAPSREVFIPSAFSPNGDGVNDVFQVFGSDPNVSGVVSLRVFDRWGNLVFARNDATANDPRQGWDGTTEGRPAAPGTYVYAAVIRFLDGRELRYSGSLQLVR